MKHRNDSSSKIEVAMVCGMMPLYRLKLFRLLSDDHRKLEFTFFGSPRTKFGLKTIKWENSSDGKVNGIRWVRTKSIFFRDSIIWQSRIMKRILFSNFTVFVFEGASKHVAIWIFALFCKLMNKKVLFWTHGFKGLDKGTKKQVRKYFFRKLADGLLLYGHHQKNIMIEDGFEPEALTVIYNSLESDKQLNIHANIDRVEILKEKYTRFKYPELFTIIFIGRLIKWKGIIEIVKAVKVFKDNRTPINCIFIGDGPEREKIIKYSDDNNLSNHLLLAGAIYDDEEIAKYFAMADLMVSPGNVGLNCMHSLAYGVPVLTHDNMSCQNPEVEAIKEAKTGLFFKHNDFDDLILKLKSWINIKTDRELISSYCQYEIKKTFNPRNQANCIINAIKEK